ncbi:hypothetical protein TCDM_12889 [Trypanosoma cruzi Dm28c]|uniref:Uncharacterized protein n=1 Tax=Trypanosoma cruzi Dm28c TaxID=1416333 RepID=V5AK63_TRYCR|nr:hypothetical protein TCDM_12889 [Trypanosoma cruzi Dm28c]
MNGCRQDALTINMAREQAATPRRNTGEKGERGKAKGSTNTRKKQIAGGKSSATALALAGNSTPALTHKHTPSRCRQSPDEKIRPSTQRRHTLPADIHRGEEQEATQRHRLQFNPTANGIRPQPAANKHNAHRASNHPKSHTRKRFLIHPAMTRCLTPCGHTERTVSPIEIIRRPSLKNASVSDGPSNTIEENGQCSNTVTPPATMSPSYRGNSPITPRMRTQSTYHIKITQFFSPETKQPHSLPNFFGHR